MNGQISAQTPRLHLKSKYAWVAALYALVAGCAPSADYKAGYTNVTIAGGNRTGTSALSKVSNFAASLLQRPAFDSNNSSKMAGGIMIYFQGTDTDSAYGQYIADENSTTIQVKNGTYLGASFGYTSAGASGQMECGVGNSGAPITFDGNAQTVGFSLSYAACGQLTPFQTGNTQNPIPALVMNSCARVFVDSSGTPSRCSGSITGNVLSASIHYRTYSRENGVMTYSVDPQDNAAGSPQSIATSCIHFNNGVSQQSLIPIGNIPALFKMPISILGYTTPNCKNSVPGSYLFDANLYSGVNNANAMKLPDGSLASFSGDLASKIEIPTTLPTPALQLYLRDFSSGSGTLSGSETSLTLSTSSNNMNINSAYTVYVDVKNVNGSPVSNKTITLSSDSADTTISPSIFTTATDGRATFTVTLNSIGNRTLIATTSGATTITSLTINAIAAATAAPTSLLYSTSSGTYTRGIAIPPNSPSSSGGAVTSYSTTSNLPPGITLNTSSGVISGIPTTVAGYQYYTITATNSMGTTNSILSITVNDVAPTNLHYPLNPASYFVGTSIAPNTPSADTALTSYSITPPLPSGLSFSTTTGEIAGTPTAATPYTTYTVTGYNSGGSTTTSIGLTVNGTPTLTSISPSPGTVLGQTLVTISGTNFIGGLTVQFGGYSCTNLTVNSPTSMTCMTPPSGLLGPVNVTLKNGGTTFVNLSNGYTYTGNSQAISTDYGTTCRIINGGAWCSGLNTSGQLGIGSTSSPYVPVPVQVHGLESGVQAITSGMGFNCAIVNGGAKCWGHNSFGNLGNSSIIDSPLPVSVTNLGSGSGVQAISAGASSVCAVASGAVKCWGDNTNGEMGYGTAGGYSTSPVLVTGLSAGVQAISAGHHTACAIVNGTVQCWGKYPGNGTAQSSTPVQVQDLTVGAQSITGGTDFNCAVVNGAAYCWGDNTSGNLGNDTINTSLSPVPVSGLASGVGSISGGGGFACANVFGSATKCWGNNGSGGLGNGTSVNSKVPVQVSGLTSGVQSIVTDRQNNTSCSLTASEVKCWGSNSHGQFGNNSTSDSQAPTTLSINPPRISYISPNASITAGTTIYIHGSNLSTVSSVKVGTSACSSLNIIGSSLSNNDDNQLTCSTPPAAGPQSVTVTNSDGSNAYLTGGLTY